MSYFPFKVQVVCDWPSSITVIILLSCNSPLSLIVLMVTSCDFIMVIVTSLQSRYRFSQGVKKRPVFVVFEYKGRGGSAEMQKDYKAFL